MNDGKLLIYYTKCINLNKSSNKDNLVFGNKYENETQVCRFFRRPHTEAYCFKKWPSLEGLKSLFVFVYWSLSISISHYRQMETHTVSLHVWFNSLFLWSSAIQLTDDASGALNISLKAIISLREFEMLCIVFHSMFVLNWAIITIKNKD